MCAAASPAHTFDVQGMRDAAPDGMRLKPFLLSLLVLTVPVACERNRTTVVRTTPTQPAPTVEARAEPIEPSEPVPVDSEPNLEEDLNNNVPEQTPTDQTPDNSGINTEQPAPNIDSAPEEPTVTPPQ
jgi:hypothetical protein